MEIPYQILGNIIFKFYKFIWPVMNLYSPHNIVIIFRILFIENFLTIELTNMYDFS